MGLLREQIGILVVDDVNTMRVQIRELLRGFGFDRIQLCASGPEAKAALEVDKIHLILADWHMQPTDGMDLLRYVRSHPDHKQTAFVMVTAESGKERVVEAIKAGVDNYLVKPLTPIEIQNKVYSVLIKKQVLG